MGPNVFGYYHVLLQKNDFYDIIFLDRNLHQTQGGGAE